MTSPTPAPEPAYADRTYRSAAGLVCGVLLIALTAWLGGDALFRGDGRTPWMALAGMLALIPLIVAFTVRPAVFANERRIRIRNPFRTIVLPWSEVADLRAGYSTELSTHAGVTYQLWAIPVSLRDRKRAARQASRKSQDDRSGRSSVNADVNDTASRLAAADQSLADLRELAEGAALRKDESTAVTTSVRWAYEVMAPAAAGIVLLAVLIAIG